MNTFKYSIGAIALCVVSSSANAESFGIEARSLAMGNTSVVTADIATAALSNPAMLAYQKSNDDFALLLPSVGVLLDDSDGVVDLIDEYQAAEAAGDNAGQVNALTQLAGKEISPLLTVATAIGFSGDTYSFGLGVRQDIIATASVTPDFGTPANSTLDLFGLRTTEIGISIARNFDLVGQKVSVGLTPKIVNIKGLFVSETLATVDTGDLVSNELEADFGDYTTLDAGLVVQVTDNLRFGAVAKNLLTEELQTPVGTIKFDTQLKAGVAYSGDFFTIAADLDITDEDTNAAAVSSKILSVGAEFNAFDFAQLRVGMQKNIASNIPDSDKDALLTAGVGFWFGFHLDASVIAGDDVLGAFVQTGFRF